MFKPRLLFVVFTIVLASTLAGYSVDVTQAGTAPPNNSPGGSIAPDPSSANAQASAQEITLVSQKIEIAVKAVGEADVATQLTGNASNNVQATVTSSYVLRNNFSGDINQGFSLPLSDLSGLKDAKGNVPEVQNFGVFVNNATMTYTVVTRTNPYGDSEPPIKFAMFSMTISAGQEVVINTTHTSPSSGQMPVAKFNFALDAANAWAGRVGESEIILRLPYPASRENVFLDESTPGGKFSEDTVRWVRRKFEPSSKDNFVVSLLAPQVWQAILDARAVAQSNPTDAESQRVLAQAYQSAISLDNGVAQGGTTQFVTLGEKAYERAIKLNQSSAPLYGAYANYLNEVHMAADMNRPRQAAARIVQIVEALKRALTLDPTNAAAIKLLAQMKTLAADVAKRNPSRASDALNPLIAEAEQLISAAPLAAPTSAPIAEATPDVNAAKAMSGPQATAIGMAQATVSASSALTTTPDAPQATAIAQAQVTLAAHATDMAIPQTTTLSSAANVTPTVSGSVSGAAQTAPSPTPTTFVGRMGLMSALSIACGVIILLGILAAVLVALFGRKQKNG